MNTFIFNYTTTNQGFHCVLISPRFETPQPRASSLCLAVTCGDVGLSDRQLSISRTTLPNSHLPLSPSSTWHSQPYPPPTRLLTTLERGQSQRQTPSIIAQCSQTTPGDTVERTRRNSLNSWYTTPRCSLQNGLFGAYPVH